MPRPLDVRGLFAFIAAAEEQDTGVIQHGVVQPISRARIDPQFMQSLPERFTVPEISGSHSSDPDCNLRPRAEILQPGQPLSDNVFARFGDVTANFDHFSKCNL